MSKARFPTLLKSKATIMGSLTRFDLVILGGCYLVLSWMKVSGLLSLGINAFVFLLLKLIDRNLPKGFFQGLRSDRWLKWSYQVGRLDE